VSGQPYARYVQRAILDPLGLTDAGFDPGGSRQALLATGYSPGLHDDHPRIAPHASMDGMAAAGQLYANVRDLARWVRWQLSGGAPAAGLAAILDPRSLAEIHRPVYLEPDWSAGQALGWRLTRVGDRVHHNHGGGIHGFASNVAFNLPGRVGAVVLANLWPSAAPARLALELIEATLDADTGARAGGEIPTGPSVRGSGGRPELAAAPACLHAYLGRYRAEPGIEVRIEHRGGELVMLPGEPTGYLLHAPTRLAPTEAPDGLRVVEGRGAGEIAAFERDGAARVRAFRLGGFRYLALRTEG
jgi:CubicO group peptidase (beta-lactamase class C family)